MASVAVGAMALAVFPFQAVNAQLMFTDAMEIPSWSVEAIYELMDQGVISGNDDGSFAPNRQLNRAEVSKIIVLAAGLPVDTRGGSPFPDVNEGDWFYDYVVTMYNYGYINGYPDGLFRPAVGINRVEMAKMIVNAFELNQDLSGAPHFTDVSAGDWFYGFVETAYNNGLMRGYGDGTFGPANPVTRAETVKIVYDSQLAVMAPTGPASGTMEVALSMATPRGTNIPYNATSVPFFTFELTASDDSDVEISSMIFTRLGLGDNDDFKSVWLEIDGFKIGNSRSINNDDIAELRFNPPIVIPAGMTLMADLVASAKYTETTDENIGHHNRFAIVSADDIVSTAQNIVGDFPIEGEEMQVASYKVSELQFASLGSDTTINVGDSFIEIGRFRILNASTTNKDVEMRALTFKTDGTGDLRDMLENVALYVSGEQVSAESIMDGRYLTFRLDDGVTGGYVIEDGDSRIFSVRADIVSAQRGDTINLKVDNYEDVVAIEIGTSFGVRTVVSGSGLQLNNNRTGTEASNCTTSDVAENNCGRLRLYTVDSGDLNVSRDPASLGNQGYAPGSNDVVFMTSRLVVDQPLLVDGVKVYLSGSSSQANGGNVLTDFNARFHNFRMFLNDRLIDSENDFAGGTGGNCTLSGTLDCYLNFDTTFEVAGTSILKIVGNIRDTAVTGDQLQLTVRASDFESVEYISTGDSVTTGQLLGTATSSYVEVAKSEVTITRTDGLSAGDKIVAGVDDVTFMSFILDNNDSGDVNVSSVSVKVDTTQTSGKTATYGNFTGAMFVGGVQQGSAKNFSSAGEATFNDLSVVIPSAGQKEFTLVMDTIESSATVVDATSSLANTAAGGDDVTITKSVAAELSVGDKIYVTEKKDPTTAAGTITETVHTMTVASIVDNAAPATTSVVTFAEGSQYAAHVAPVAGSAGDTTINVTAPALATDTLALISNGPTTFCTITFTAGPEDYDCSNGIATLNPDTAANINDKLLALTGTGYTITQPGAAGTAVVFTETATPFIVGNVTLTATRRAGGSTFAATATVGTAGVATETGYHVALKHQIQVDVVAVDADNIENGSSVDVLNGGAVVSATNPLAGNVFEFVSAGTLNVDLGSTVYSDILVAGQNDVEVFKIRLSASDDEVHVRDLHLTNSYGAAIGDRANFKLYNEAGQLIQEKRMTGGKIHFQLANNQRIRVPKDGATTVTVKVDAGSVSQADQTGKRLKLSLDTGLTNGGIQALTAATGMDITTPADGWESSAGTVVSQDFVLYRSVMSVNHASSQPAFNGADAAMQGVYRFTVTADNAYDVELGQLTFNVTTSGGMSMDNSGGATDTTFDVYRVNDNGNVDTNTNLTGTSPVVSAINTTFPAIAVGQTSATVEVRFANQTISNGSSVTYELHVSNTSDATATVDDSVGVTIATDTAYVTPNTRANLLGGASNIVWSDYAGNPHSDTSADWLSGYLLNVDTTSKINKE